MKMIVALCFRLAPGSAAGSGPAASEAVSLRSAWDISRACGERAGRRDGWRSASFRALWRRASRTAVCGPRGGQRESLLLVGNGRVIGGTQLRVPAC